MKQNNPGPSSIGRKRSRVPASALARWLVFGLVLCVSTVFGAVKISVQADKPGARINPAMWGIFFEDINLGADGGLYAELVKNRSFEFPDALMGWKQAASGGAQGKVEVRTEGGLSADNPHYVRVTADGKGQFGLSNEGFRGMGFRQSETYVFSARVRVTAGAPAMGVELMSAEGKVIGAARLEGFSRVWQAYTISVMAGANEPGGHLRVILDGQGSLDLDMVSLFPQHTWKGRPGGLRADLVQALADLKPGFMRFPGGCIVEGHYLTNRYQWKTTIGAPENRKLIVNRWNDEFKHRPTPDYYQSFGLGFFEFFQLCEDIGAEPLPILNCGMACQFNSGELAPMDQLEPYIQDALDLIEFANGPTTSAWGARRAAMGHPAPFKMKLLGVGNEQWGPQYFERYEPFAKAVKARHPEVQLVSSAGPSPDDDRFRLAWEKLRAAKADIVDEHCYAAPKWFLDNAGRYDSCDRQGPKVFMGEYAAQSVATVSPKNRNNLECALAEAAYMTGLERNAEVVRMASYAPLFAHVEGWQWTPNLIWFDNLRVSVTPNYYAQMLFSRNRGDIVLPTRVTADPGPPGERIFASATQDEQSGEMILKVVNPSTQAVSARLEISGVKVEPSGKETVLAGNPTDENTVEKTQIVPMTKEVQGVSENFSHTFRPFSFEVLRIRTTVK